MLLNLCSKVAFTGAKEKIKKIKRDEPKDKGQQRRTPNAKLTLRPLNSSLTNGLTNYQLEKNVASSLEVLQVGPNVESKLNDGIIKLTNPTVMQLSEAIQAAALTGKRIIVNGQNLSRDVAKSQPKASAAECPFEANMRRFLEKKSHFEVNSLTATARALMCRSLSADDIHHETRSIDTPESTVMRVRSEHRLISIHEMDSDDSDCESLTESEGSVDPTMTTFKSIKQLECPTISIVKPSLSVSVKVQEWSSLPQTALLCYMIHFAHLVFVVACLRGML